MRRRTPIAMSALIGPASLSSVAMARAKTPSTKTGQQVVTRHGKRGGRYDGRGFPVTSHGQHELTASSNGYRWVRGGNEFILAGTATGLIASVVRAAGTSSMPPAAARVLRSH